MRERGAEVPGWRVPPRPEAVAMTGRYARLEPLAADHAEGLFAAYAGAPTLWDYLPYGPHADLAAQAEWVAHWSGRPDPVFFAIRGEDGQVGGVASYLRIAPEAGSIEVGHINLSPSLQGSRAATEAMVLMMGWAFAAGYRRYEWKCDALNLPSRRAAERLGLSYEGVFRQAAVVKGRNRDTAWFAAIDREWPALKAAFGTWLDPGNFDAAGRQTRRLSALTRPILAARDPVLAAKG